MLYDTALQGNNHCSFRTQLAGDGDGEGGGGGGGGGRPLKWGNMAHALFELCELDHN